MPAITLTPVPREAPECARFDDVVAVRAYEREVRAHRACVEPFSLERTEAALLTTWYVKGGSGSEYAVDLVDGEQWDTCTCPDFLGNELGTCKHIEAVRRAIRTRPPLRKAFEKARAAALLPTLTVRAEGPIALIALGAWNLRTLRSLGLDRDADGDVRVVDSEKLLIGELRSGVRVTCGAKAAARILHEREWRRRRRATVDAAVEGGSLGLDVLKRPLFPYQLAGVQHLAANGRAMLADDMGLGKTVQALAACEVLRRRGEATRVLVVTSATLKHQWAREIERYTGASASVIGGAAAARREALESDTPYKVLNYELTWRELQTLQTLEADVLILDEAQRAKNFRTRTATTLRAIPSRFLFVLTGTPVENRLDDLYALLQLVDPDVLGPLWRFNLDFHAQNARGRVEGYRNLGALRQRTAPWVLRRRKEEVLSQLPPLVEQTRYTGMTEAQVQLEGGYRAEAAQLLSIAERRPLSKEEMQAAMGLLLKARQACNAVELCDREREPGSPKLDEFESLVGEIVAQGPAKILVFSEWTEMLKLAARRLDGLKVGWTMLHGGVNTERRPALIERFKTDPDLRVLLSTDAGGTGLNLQVASYVIHLDLPWNPGRLDQRTARAHRLGQTRGVVVTYLCAEGGIERAIERVLGQKREMRGAALDGASSVNDMEVTSFMNFARTVTTAAEEEVAEEPPTEAAAEAALVVAEGSDAVLTTAAEVLEEEVAVEAAVHDAPVVEAAPVVVETAVAEGVVAPQPASDATTALGADRAEPAVTSATPRRSVKAVRADNRLRLAKVVLDAGFPADAVRAAYEALAEAVRALLDAEVAATHGALVAAVYKELIPTGRLPMAAHATLATLHDLASLDAHGIEVDAGLAQRAVDDAAEWVRRLAEA
jgi:superfamily II DNA or RNA helicase